MPLVLFALLALCVCAGYTSRLEGWAYQRAVARMNPTFTAVLRGITHTGDTVVVLAFCLLLIAYKRTRKTVALPIALAVIVSTLLNSVLKPLFSRQRPSLLRLVNESSYSFPSGHAMVTATLFTMLVLLAFWFFKSRLLKFTVTALCVFMILAIGFSRIYLGVHFAGDVLGGWLIGFSVAVRVYFFWSVRHIKTELLEQSSPMS